MNKYKMSVLLLPLLAACGTPDGYKIKGEYPDAKDGTKVYMTMLDEEFTYIDSALVVDGEFEFSGRQDTPVVRMLVSSIAPTGGPVVLENGNIEVALLGSGCHRRGTPLNDDLQRYTAERLRMSAAVDAVAGRIADGKAVSAAEGDSLRNVIANKKGEFVAVLQDVIGGNMGNALGAFLLTQSESFFTPAEMYGLMSQVPEHLHDTRFKAMQSRVKDAVERKTMAMFTSPGSQYINFELPDVNGKHTLFSDIVNKNRYTLLAFWASWSPECRQELPAIRDINDRYADKGVAVVSLSLDSSTDEWKEAVGSLGMTWTQLCSPSGGSAEVAAAYGVESIPALLLIDDKGKIVLRDMPARRVAERIGRLIEKNKNGAKQGIAK